MFRRDDTYLYIYSVCVKNVQILTISAIHGIGNRTGDRFFSVGQGFCRSAEITLMFIISSVIAGSLWWGGC